jgi:hypothetical protein
LLVWHPLRLLSAFFMWPDCGLMVGIKPLQRIWQLRKVRCDPSCLVFAEHPRR